jgi:hypothetical protein
MRSEIIVAVAPKINIWPDNPSRQRVGQALNRAGANKTIRPPLNTKLVQCRRFKPNQIAVAANESTRTAFPKAKNLRLALCATSGRVDRGKAPVMTRNETLATIQAAEKVISAVVLSCIDFVVEQLLARYARAAASLVPTTAGLGVRAVRRKSVFT